MFAETRHCWPNGQRQREVLRGGKLGLFDPEHGEELSPWCP